MGGMIKCALIYVERKGLRAWHRGCLWELFLEGVTKDKIGRTSGKIA